MVEVEDVAIPAGDSGRVMVRIFRPAESQGPLPVVLYLPGPQALDDDAARELAVTEGVAVLVPESARDIETSHDLLHWIVAEGARRQLDGGHVALMGDGLVTELAVRAQLPLRPTPTPPAP
jgi:acetyl esterase/lipase